MRRIVFRAFAGLMVSLCLVSLAFAPQASASASQALESGVERDVPDAFSTSAHDWHTVVVDLGSNALVRIYGRILTEAFPTDVTVGVSEHLSSVSAWIGDSGGNRIRAAQSETDAAQSGDRYLVIEGKAASADVAEATSVHFISYKIDGQSKIQFVDIPVQARAASAAAATDDAGGCSTGLGFSGAAVALGLFALGRRLKRA
ncbi:hypothetical protein LJC31_06510 [Synergistaceae bacterium OttesenSCG-928-I11]|nr:hypothetical protein [Synergistaceae bacterium OttesenSCG-928-I11]